ncbi:MAG: 30S ribosomal protein S20 [Burkholderiales bacterium]
MANIASARKRARQAEKRRTHNMSMRTAVRSAIKSVKKAIVAGDKPAAERVLQASQSVIDRVASKRVLHRKAADRHKSRLSRAIKALA